MFFALGNIFLQASIGIWNPKTEGIRDGRVTDLIQVGINPVGDLFKNRSSDL